MAKEIQLTKGRVALVDDDDFELLSRFNWCAKFGSRRTKWYAVRKCTPEERKVFGTQQISMHRWLMRPPRELVVDHVNHDSLDNRRSNLEVITQVENMARSRGWRRKGVPVSRAVLEDIEAILGG